MGYASEDKSADCVNVNECLAETDTCSENELCFDTIGSYQCNSVPSKFILHIASGSKVTDGLKDANTYIQFETHCRQGNAVIYYAGI